MRRIIIDDNIRSWANSYSAQVQLECPNVVLELEELRDVVVAKNNWTDPSAVRGYIDALINDYPAILTLEPSQWDFAKYKAFTDKEPEMLSKKVVYGYTKGSKKKGVVQPPKPKEGIFYERIMFCLRYKEARAILGPIHMQMGLKTCVYCNAVPSLSSNDGEVFYEMDHLKPESLYPFLGTCFYNLQPSDGSCNKRKLTQPCDFQLFVNDQTMPLSPYIFLPQVVELKNTKGYGCLKIDFCSQDGTKTAESKAHDTTFKITSRYLQLGDKVVDIYWRNQTAARTGQVANYINGLGYQPTRNEITEFCLGCPYDETLIHEDVYRKLRFDTIRQLEENNLLNM